MRSATIQRTTRETDIAVTVSLDGTGASRISTGIGFFDHMLDQLARHSLIDIEIAAKGDLHIDFHHTVEDTGIALGQALRKALGDLKGITRYADVCLPMDAGITLHIETLYGFNEHHIAESCFKATARALRAAVTLDSRQGDRIPSTKGAL